MDIWDVGLWYIGYQCLYSIAEALAAMGLMRHAALRLLYDLLHQTEHAVGHVAEG